MTNTYSTGNPLGSSALKDLSDNASNFDEAMNLLGPAFTDRFGNRRETLYGLQQLVQDYLVSAGYTYVADYAAGVTLSARNQYVIYQGNAYVVANGTALPYVTTGTWATDLPKLKLITDSSLRQDLANSSDPAKGAALIGIEGTDLATYLATAGTDAVLTRTALKAREVLSANRLVYLGEGLRAGLFVSVAGAIPVADPNEAIYISSNTAGYFWERVGAEHVNFLWCGADVNYTATTNNWAAWIQAVRFCGATGMPLYIPAGRYGFVNAPQIAMDDFKTQGLLIYGDGHARSILDMRSVLTSPNMHITGSPTTAMPFSDTYYLNLKDIGMIGNIGAALGAPGYILQLGKDDLSDPPNLYNWEGVGVQNFDTTDWSRAVKMNYVVGSKFDIQFNCGSGGTGGVGGKGIALTMRNCGFNQFFGSVGSAGIAIQMEDLYNYGNQFNCMDMENVAICVRTLGTLNQSNTWIGGRWAYFTAGFDAQKGTSNVVLNPDIGAGGGATPTGFVAAKAGLEVIGARGIYPLTSPGVPASGVDVANPNARKVTVGIFGGTVQQIRVNGQVYSGLTGGFVPIGPEDTIGITYTSAPTWVWRT